MKDHLEYLMKRTSNGEYLTSVIIYGLEVVYHIIIEFFELQPTKTEYIL